MKIFAQSEDIRLGIFEGAINGIKIVGLVLLWYQNMVKVIPLESSDYYRVCESVVSGIRIH